MPITFFARPSTSSTTIVLDPTTGQPVISPTCPVPVQGAQGVPGAPGRGIDMVEAVGSTLVITFSDGTTQEVDMPAGSAGATVTAYGPTEDGTGLKITLSDSTFLTAALPSSLIAAIYFDGPNLATQNLAGEDLGSQPLPDVRFEVADSSNFPAGVDRPGNWKCATSEPHAPVIYFRVHDTALGIYPCEIDMQEGKPLLPGYVNIATGQVQALYVADAIYSQGAGTRQVAFSLRYYGWAFVFLGLRIKAEFTTNGGDSTDTLSFSIRDRTNGVATSAQLTGEMEPLSLIDVQAGFAYPFTGTLNMYIAADSSSRLGISGTTVPHMTARQAVPDWSADDELRELEVAITASGQFNAQFLAARLEIGPLKGRFESPTP